MVIGKWRSRSEYDKKHIIEFLEIYWKIAITCSVVDEYVALDKMLTDPKKLIQLDKWEWILIIQGGINFEDSSDVHSSLILIKQEKYKMIML